MVVDSAVMTRTLHGLNVDCGMMMMGESATRAIRGKCGIWRFFSGLVEETGALDKDDEEEEDDDDVLDGLKLRFPA